MQAKQKKYLKIGIVGVGCFFAFSVVQKLGKGIADKVNDALTSDAAKAEKAQLENLKKAEESLKGRKVTLTKDKYFYTRLANEVENAMAEPGNSGWPPAFNALEKLTKDDLLQVVISFGVRFNKGLWGYGDFTGDLFKWFDREYGGWMDSGVYSRLKTIFAPLNMWK